MNGKRILAIVIRQGYLMRGSFSRVLPLFAWVAVDIILWGYLTRYLSFFPNSSMNFVPVILGAVLFWNFFMRIMQGMTIAFFEDVWSRNFLNLFATPMSISDYVVGLVVTSILTSFVGLLAMIVLASAVFGLSMAVYGIMTLPFLMNLFLFGVALGIFACCLVLRFGPAAEWFIWPIPALVSPFVGVLYPVHILPGWMQAVSVMLPPTYVFETLRTLIAGEPVSWMMLWVSIGLNLIYVAAALLTFHKTYRYAIKVGLIARYSAETAG